MLVAEMIRADSITRSGIIQPFDVRQFDPTDVVRAFQTAYNENGPAPLTAQQMAAAAEEIAQAFAKRESVRIRQGANGIVAQFNGPDMPGTIGVILRAARRSVSGEGSVIRSGREAALVRAIRGTNFMPTTTPAPYAGRWL